MSANNQILDSQASSMMLHPEVRKPTATIHIANQFSFIERKLLNSLIHHAQNKNNALNSEKKSLNLSQVLKDIGCNTRNHSVLKKSLRNLVGTIIEWNVLKQDKTRSWGVCTFLSSGELNKGEVHYRLNPELVDQVNYPSLFAIMRLEIQSKLTGKYPLIIYEYLIDHLCRNKKDKITIEAVPIEDVYMICGVSEKYLNTDNFRYFNRKILTPAIDEINDKTDINVTINLERQARKVHAITFSISKNKQTTSDDTNAHPLIKYGVDEKVANSLLSRYDKKRIKENLDYALNRQSIKKVDNIASYIVAAIKNNYAATFDNDNNDLLAVVSKNEIKPKTHKGSNFNREKEYYLNQPEDWQKNELSEFEEEIQREGNTILLSAYKKNGLDSGIVSSKFYQRFKI